MAVEIFNPNPTIFAPVKTSKASSKSDYLWVNDPSESRLDGEDVEEPIDQDEIFGTFRNEYFPSPTNNKNNLHRFDQVYI